MSDAARDCVHASTRFPKVMMAILDSFPPLIRSKNKDGQSLLHAAVSNSQLISTFHLIGMDMDINATTNDTAGRRPPLHYAPERCSVDLIKLLLWGSDINALDRMEMSARHLAGVSNCEDRAAAVQILISEGAARCTLAKLRDRERPLDSRYESLTDAEVATIVESEPLYFEQIDDTFTDGGLLVMNPAMIGLAELSACRDLQEGRDELVYRIYFFHSHNLTFKPFKTIDQKLIHVLNLRLLLSFYPWVQRLNLPLTNARTLSTSSKNQEFGMC